MVKIQQILARVAAMISNTREQMRTHGRKIAPKTIISSAPGITWLQYCSVVSLQLLSSLEMSQPCSESICTDWYVVLASYICVQLVKIVDRQAPQLLWKTQGMMGNIWLSPDETTDWLTRHLNDMKFYKFVSFWLNWRGVEWIGSLLTENMLWSWWWCYMFIWENSFSTWLQSIVAYCNTGLN